MSMRVAVLTASILMATACSSSWSPKILAVHGDAGSTRLDLAVDTCNQDPQVTVVESPTEVRLTAKAEGSGRSGDDCLDSVHVTLSEPLGDRAVIDNATDLELTLSPPAE
jgi:hypothetical protein